MDATTDEAATTPLSSTSDVVGVVEPTAPPEKPTAGGLRGIGAVDKFDEAYAKEFQAAAFNSAPPLASTKGDGENLMQKVKDAGAAGIISYIFWEWVFWGVSVPVALFGFQGAFGYWPDFSNQDDLAKLGAEAFAFVNVARFAVPLRISLALGTTPWVKDNIVGKIGFLQKKEDKVKD